ncbi:Phenylalanyl-tRNA synthetase alpha chain isoform 2 [Theobroma cacao]|uniref:Phenylalanyl-tRNA synthetase alpha chain isoform 2 n=1 Tax=Theobroma cacao TaxID=3641 RepID=A0A061DZ74_THECC|nr:Phenylalanyl-tRNA synthetase alpha chain isoform 2 [Theobroma cacao]
MAEDAILGYLATHEEIPDSGQFASQHGLQHNDVVNVIKSLHGFRYIDAQDIKRESWVLTDEGKKYAAEGSPEVQLFLAIPPEGSISKDELQKKLDPSVFKIGCSQAGKNKWVDMGKQVSRKVQHVEDKVKDLLIRIQDGQAIGKDDINSLKARKLIVAQTWKGYSVRKGPNYAPKRKKVATDLTRENLQRGDWKELEFKEYNFNAKGPPAEAGHLHPLLKVKQQLKNIFLQMGFEEMPTNNFVESSFWNFDALFQPQQHPARDSHDTFFMEAPSTTRELQACPSCVSSLLTTHTPNLAWRYSGDNYHEGLKKWVEIGNSGMFRPEMLLPMGFPEDVRVIAWGLSLERWILVSSKGIQSVALELIRLWNILVIPFFLLLIEPRIHQYSLHMYFYSIYNEQLLYQAFLTSFLLSIFMCNSGCDHSLEHLYSLDTLPVTVIYFTLLRRVNSTCFDFQHPMQSQFVILPCWILCAKP